MGTGLGRGKVKNNAALCREERELQRERVKMQQLEFNSERVGFAAFSCQPGREQGSISARASLGSDHTR